MNDITIPPFSFPAVARKKVTADFDGGRLTSDGGVILLAMAERRRGIGNGLRDVPQPTRPDAHHPYARRHDPHPRHRDLLRLRGR